MIGGRWPGQRCNLQESSSAGYPLRVLMTSVVFGDIKNPHIIVADGRSSSFCTKRVGGTLITYDFNGVYIL